NRPVLNVPVINPPPTATPVPATTVPVATATTGGPVPVVIEFTADKTTISSGQCANLTWRVEGIKAVYLQGGGVVGAGTVQVCPTTTTTYNLKVIKMDNVEDNRYITITVQ
ncbi:MAG TPA: hypothetical protein VHP83_20565, partial [Aggregatilineaceae bacterium]|nr:hypothetical protein [Aggregatilineaceae bacterium]